MQRPPHSAKAGIFTWPVVIDTMVYGTIMGATCLLSVRDILQFLGDFEVLTVDSVCDRCIRQRQWRSLPRVQSFSF